MWYTAGGSCLEGHIGWLALRCRALLKVVRALSLLPAGTLAGPLTAYEVLAVLLLAARKPSIAVACFLTSDIKRV